MIHWMRTHSDHYATGSKDAPSGAERASAFAAD